MKAEIAITVLRVAQGLVFTASLGFLVCGLLYRFDLMPGFLDRFLARIRIPKHQYGRHSARSEKQEQETPKG